MKLPEEMPLELNSKILSAVHGCECEDCHSLLTAHYKMIAYYFNNLPVDWRPVSERPERECAVWLFDGDIVTFGIFVADVFAPIGDGISEYRRTHWAYCNLPEPPKE